MKTQRETTWIKFECGGGSRWTSTGVQPDRGPCNFSGCNCKTQFKAVGTTTSRDEAASWFHRGGDNLKQK